MKKSISSVVVGCLWLLRQSQVFRAVTHIVSNSASVPLHRDHFRSVGAKLRFWTPQVSDHAVSSHLEGRPLDRPIGISLRWSREPNVTSVRSRRYVGFHPHMTFRPSSVQTLMPLRARKRHIDV